MNPLMMLKADLRALRWTAVAIVFLIATAVGVGFAIQAQERAFRQSTAQAADDFDILIGSAGSQSQLVLSVVFLQPEALPLIDGALYTQLKNDKRVKGVASIAFGDISHGSPIIGTHDYFVTRWGRLAFTEGRNFTAPFEAVVGADVLLTMGETFEPSHTALGASHEEEEEHKHGEKNYKIVGRLPKLGTPWDKAILVPIESVWAVHELTKAEEKKIPALVVKPYSVADAYALRGQYRQGGTMAFFPAEVLVSLYGTLGNAKEMLFIVSILNGFLVFAAILLLFWAINSLSLQRYILLRALGAPRHYVFLLVWLNAFVLLLAGCSLGLLFGWGGAAIASFIFAHYTGLQVNYIFDSKDIIIILALSFVVSLLALIPAIQVFKSIKIK